MIRVNLILLSSLICFFSFGCGKDQAQKETIREVVLEKPVIIRDSSSATSTVMTSDASLPKISFKRVVSLSPDFSNYSDFKDSINKYFVVLENAYPEWEGGVLRCVNSRRGNEYVDDYIANNNSHISLSIPLNQQETVSEYKCGVYKDKTSIDRFADSREVVVRLKKSFIVSSRVNLSEVLGVTGRVEIGALVLESDAKVMIKGEKYSVKSEMLVIEDSRGVPSIGTYTDEELKNVTPCVDGKSGGFLILNIEKVYGSRLKIAMRGQDGGEQSRRPEKILAQPLPAADGYLNEFNCARDERGGYSCDQVFINAANGLSGYQGLQGFTGTKGGDTGFVTLNVAKENLLTNISFEIEPGKGSRGGRGGEGGDGGLGGKNPDGSRANQGPKGPEGQQGNDGSSGLRNLSCLHSLSDNDSFCGN